MITTIINGYLYSKYGKRKIYTNDVGYKFITYKKPCGKWGTVQVSRIIHDAHIFDSHGEGLIEIIDGDKDNLEPSNLRLASQSWLSKKAARNNRFKGRSISDASQDLIKKDKRPKAQIAHEYGVTARTIRRVTN